MAGRMPAYQLHGEDYPAPPPSLAMILARSQSGYGGLTQTFNSSWRNWRSTVSAK